MQKQLEDRLSALKDFFHHSKRLPSYSELQKLWDLASKNAVFKAIHNLIEEGFLQKDTHNKLAPTPLFFALNLYGQVPAGFPVPTPDDQADALSLESYLIEKPSATFLLKVSGDSLKDLGILPGDLALLEKTKNARRGQVVLARVDGEWTLKILAKDKNRLYLQPANSNYAPIIPKNELSIYGVVKGVVRKYI
ncbi:MAG: S24 family peptidase [Patescibacteria group bacterium]|jgi:repressor LexA